MFKDFDLFTLAVLLCGGSVCSCADIGSLCLLRELSGPFPYPCLADVCIRRDSGVPIGPPRGAA